MKSKRYSETVPSFQTQVFRFTVAFLAALPLLVHIPGAALAQTLNPPVERDISALPAEVQRMRDAILSAAFSGSIEELRVAVEMNEIPPVLAGKKVADPVAHWKAISGDGEGREILAVLVKLFRTGFARINAGKPDEMIVWPYFAEVPLKDLTPPQQVELLTLVTAEDFKAMREGGNYTGWRLAISATGVWHSFTREN